MGNRNPKKVVQHIVDVCRIGQGAECCRYLIAGASGLECGKVNPSIKSRIDERADKMNAKGDNCEGKEKIDE